MIFLINIRTVSISFSSFSFLVIYYSYSVSYEHSLSRIYARLHNVLTRRSIDLEKSVDSFGMLESNCYRATGKLISDDVYSYLATQNRK